MSQTGGAAVSADVPLPPPPRPIVLADGNNAGLLKPSPERPRAGQEPGPSAEDTAPAAAGHVTVAPGDTVYAIARRHHVGVRDIIDLNNLRPPYRLLVGQRLALPVARRYAVVSGDTLYGLSRRLGVDMSVLVRLNRLRAPYRLSVGQLLEIPNAVRAPELAQESRSGNDIPDDTKRVRDETPRTGTGGGRFVWPAEGRLLSTFGDKGGGNFNEGINIAAAAGSRVRAAADGMVAYAGNELRGYGNLLLIRHADGWMSAYAHNEELLVERGDTVSRGQAIATVGRTGNVARPQSHFELRRRGKAVDPLRFLPPRSGAG